MSLTHCPFHSSQAYVPYHQLLFQALEVVHSFSLEQGKNVNHDKCHLECRVVHRQGHEWHFDQDFQTNILLPQCPVYLKQIPT